MQPATDHLGQGGLQLCDTDSPVCPDRHDRYRQLAPKAVEVDHDVVFFGHVEHVYGQDNRQPQLHHLAEQVEIALEIAGVDDAKHGVYPGRVLAASEQKVDRHHLVARAWGKAVEAGQVDQLKPAPPVVQPADLPFDRGPGIVSHVLMDTDQSVEQRRLAGVRIADQGDGQRGLFAGDRHGASRLAQPTGRVVLVGL